jgi:hypothetical protein
MTMRRLIRLTLAVAVVSVFTAQRVAAQNYWFDIGANVGGSMHTPTLGSAEGFNGGDAKFGTGWLLGSQLTLWPTSRFGLRGNFNYSDRPYDANAQLSSSVKLWSGSGDVMIRFKTPHETWSGKETLPYVALGLGRKWVNPSGNQLTCYDRPRSQIWTCLPLQQGAGATNTFALGDWWKEALMVLVGVGADYRMTPNWLLRFELSDRMYKPQIEAVSRFLGGNLYDVPDGEANLSKRVHEISLQAGIHLTLGKRGPTEMMAPPPPVQQQPPPQQQQQQQPPPPAPPPPPRVDDISVCVLDTGAPNGVRTLDAQYRYASNDTVVMVGGNPQPIRSAVSSINTAGNADWFVRGTPFIMQMGRYREEFVTYGRPEIVGCPNLVHVGMVNGFPVYVNPGDVTAYRAELQAAVAAANGDLAAALAGNTRLRTQFDAVRSIWIPIDPVGPRMQALQRQEQVRKDEQ